MDPADREWCRKLVFRDKPKLLVVSPPCTLFSQLQNLSLEGLPAARCPEEWAKATLMVEFAVELCLIQKRAGRVFVFEHPRTATSWEVVRGLKELLETPDVIEAVLDMCVFGLSSVDPCGKQGLVRKTTRLLTNSEELANATAHRCRGGHGHVHLLSGRAKRAAIYTSSFCDAVLKGFSFWKLRKDSGKSWHARELLNVSRPDMCDLVEEKLIEESGQYIDDIKGSVLDRKLTQKVRGEEIEVFAERGVYDVIHKSKLPPNARIVGVRWVDTNKGSDDAPRIRSRLVAQDFNIWGDPTGEMFAPTPPLGATRYLLSCLASRGWNGPGMYRAMLLDFKRAFLYGDCEREVFIQLPEEDPRAQEGMVGDLRKAMYGTCDASAVWQKLVRKVSWSSGLLRCVHLHAYMNIGLEAYEWLRMLMISS